MCAGSSSERPGLHRAASVYGSTRIVSLRIACVSASLRYHFTWLSTSRILPPPAVAIREARDLVRLVDETGPFRILAIGGVDIEQEQSVRRLLNSGQGEGSGDFALLEPGRIIIHTREIV